MLLNYREFGSGKALIVLHGLYGSSDNWVTVGKRLSKLYRVILVDLRNHGGSPHSATHTYTAMADDVVRLAKHIGLDEFLLMGHSMGGKAAMLLAAQYPSIVRRLIIVDIAPSNYGSVSDNNSFPFLVHRQILAAMLSIPTETLTSRQQADSLLSLHVEDVRVRQFLLKNIAQSTGGGYRWRFNINTISESIGVIMGNPFEEGSFTPSVGTPTLFLKGELSPYIDSRFIPDVQNHFNDYRMSIVSKAGHWLHVERMDAFLREVELFLREG